MIEKSEIRKGIFHNLGCDADDWLDGAKRDSNAFEGAKKSLKKSAQELIAIAAVVKKDLDDGKLDGLEPAEIADYAILQVTRCRDSLENASKHFENRQIASQGEIAAYEKVVDYFKKLYDREETRMQALAQAIESGEIIVEDDGAPVSQGDMRGNLTGIRPGSSIAAQRKAEAAAEASKEGAAAVEPGDGGGPSGASGDAVEVTAEEEPKKKRRRRKKSEEDSA